MSDVHTGEGLSPSPGSPFPFIRTPERGTLKHVDLFASARSCGMRSGYVTLCESDTVGEHTTGHHEELLVVIEGEGEVHLGTAERHAIAAGQVVYIPPETLHNVKNTQATPLRYIYIVAPAVGER